MCPSGARVVVREDVELELRRPCSRSDRSLRAGHVDPDPVGTAQVQRGDSGGDLVVRNRLNRLPPGRARFRRRRCWYRSCSRPVRRTARIQSCIAPGSHVQLYQAITTFWRSGDGTFDKSTARPHGAVQSYACVDPFSLSFCVDAVRRPARRVGANRPAAPGVPVRRLPAADVRHRCRVHERLIVRPDPSASPCFADNDTLLARVDFRPIASVLTSDRPRWYPPLGKPRPDHHLPRRQTFRARHARDRGGPAGCHPRERRDRRGAPVR